MALTDTAVRHAKPRAKDYTLPDYNGLALFVNTNGAKCWHFRFSWADKQPRISLGTYPEVSLRNARALRDVARAQVARGIDPRVHRQLERNARRLATENA
ncbi:Arm DNA-binding domain-containing protein [Pseudomonas sp. P9_35]|uniref:Arm DNA-binding domain-containing protein n=1 Tax=unclassified Pseudomonas TaxID=196821 RepID=UPI002A35A000|nr:MULTISPECIES: Arm DNA-binding domain-containing protein [unclassified Pseudomonas]WPN65634.1 Arm DNA-binding domain-containing protein [Pseudomonas sp. P9_32]WPN71384.1 Arm DNA-binding domain-containing protein [Pseudomonas sp. P9_35]